MPKQARATRLAAVLAIQVGDGDGPAARSAEGPESDRIHHQLVDPTLARLGGQVLELAAGRTLVAFDQPRMAIEAALEIALGMVEHQAASPGARLALRFGLDHGEVRAEPSGMPDLALRVATRLAAAADPNGVVASATLLRQVPRRQVNAEPVARGTLEISPGTEVAIVALRPRPTPGERSPWPLRRRWTLLATVAALLLLVIATMVLWRPLLERWVILPSSPPAAGETANGHPR